MEAVSLAGATAAVWLGLLTALSPCPLATHLAAVSFITREMHDARRIWHAGLAYAAGRMITYVVLAGAATLGVLSAMALSDLTQQWVNRILGPLLLFVGLGLFDVVPLPSWHAPASAAWAGRLARRGDAGALALGAVLALGFCPLSAALFFGSLVPLASRAGSIALYPGLYGLASAAPVAVLAIGAAVGARWVARTLPVAARLELWGRRFTGVTFVAVGVYLCVRHLYGA